MNSSNNAVIRRQIHVRGVVQGVGFRPFVYNLAQSFALAGFVFNSSSGVTIEVEGSEAAVDAFLRGLNDNPPPLAQITETTVTAVEPMERPGFSILESREEAGEFGLVPADAGTCDECWRDSCDPTNRRYGYPFTNCTHCGPRYTIIRNIPYDRAATTMASFTMCPACQAEYEDPTNRRFHAQPNACAVCGPSLALVESGASLTGRHVRGLKRVAGDARGSRAAAEWKDSGSKGLGGFLLACDAGNAAAVEQLRQRKRRPDKPFALMARDVMP